MTFCDLRSKRVAIATALFLAAGNALAQDDPSASIAGDCPNPDADPAKLYPDDCDSGPPPSAYALVAGDAMLEGVWQIEFETPVAAYQWFAAIHRGVPGVGFRAPDSVWSMTGMFQTYAFTPKVSSQEIRFQSDGYKYGGYTISGHRGGGSSAMTGRWEKGDDSGAVQWRKLPPPRITAVRSETAWRDAEGVNYRDASTPGGRPLRIEANHPVTCGFGEMSGNCPRVSITVEGSNLAQPTAIWLAPNSHLQLRESRFVTASGASMPTTNLKYAVGSDDTAAVVLDFNARDATKPGPLTLWYGNQAIAMEVVINGYPTLATDLPPDGIVPVVDSFANMPDDVDRSRCTCQDVTLARVDSKDYAGQDTSILRRLGFGDPPRYVYNSKTIYRTGDPATPPESGPFIVPPRGYLDQVCFYFTYPQELAYTATEGRPGACRVVVNVVSPSARSADGFDSNSWQLYSVRGMQTMQTHAKNFVCLNVGVEGRDIPSGKGSVDWSVEGQRCPQSPVEFTVP